MPACLSCGAEISGGLACSKCGAKAPALGVPDLDLSPVSAPPPRVASATRRTSGAMAAVTTADDALDDEAGEASFELAVLPGEVGMPPPSLSPTSAANASFRPNPMSNPPSSGRASGPARTTSGSLPRVSGIPQEAPRDPSHPDVRISKPPVVEEAPRIDPLEARAFANYGAPPPSVLQSPVYAFRVKMRQSELRSALWRAKIAFERAQKDQSRALADPSRLEEVKLRLAADVAAKEHEVDLHEAALLAFDAPWLKRGTQISYAACAIMFVAIFLPIFFRMCIGVDAPPLPP